MLRTSYGVRGEPVRLFLPAVAYHELSVLRMCHATWQEGAFMVGVDGMYGFCTYDHAGMFTNSNTYGVKAHISAQQPLWRDLSYVLRAGVQKERILSKDDLPEINLTIFTVECLVVLGL